MLTCPPFFVCRGLHAEHQNLKDLVRSNRYGIHANQDLSDVAADAFNFKQNRAHSSICRLLSSASMLFDMHGLDKDQQKQIDARVFSSLAANGNHTVLDSMSWLDIVVNEPHFAGPAATWNRANKQMQLSANNHYLLSALGNFIRTLQYSIGTRNRGRTHPGHIFENFKDDYVKKLEQGFHGLLTWLQVYGCQAWFFQICDHVDHLIVLIVQYLATLHRDFGWLFDSVEFAVDLETKLRLNMLFKWTWGLLWSLGAVQHLLCPGMVLPVGVLQKTKRTKRKASQLLCTPKPIRRSALPTVGMISEVWPWFPESELEAWLPRPSGKFIHAFAKLFRVSEIPAERILSFLPDKDMLTLQTFIEFWACGGGKVVEDDLLSEDQASKSVRVM